MGSKREKKRQRERERVIVMRLHMECNEKSFEWASEKQSKRKTER